MKRFLKRADEIIAHDLILLICFPVILGCFIDIALVDFRYLLTNKNAKIRGFKLVYFIWQRHK